MRQNIISTKIVKLKRKKLIIFIVIFLVIIATAIWYYFYQKSNSIVDQSGLNSEIIQQPAETIKKIDDSISTTTDNTEKISSYNAKIYLLQATGDKEGAIQVALKLIELDPSKPSYYGRVAQLYSDVGDSVKAIEYFNKAVAACDALPVGDDNTSERQYYSGQINGLSYKS